MKWPGSERLLRLAAVCALIALALMAWGLLAPSVVSVMVSMMLGQVVGTASLGLYLLVMARDLRRSRLLEREVERHDAEPE
jgi:hypothetical protein